MVCCCQSILPLFLGSSASARQAFLSLSALSVCGCVQNRPRARTTTLLACCCGCTSTTSAKYLHTHTHTNVRDQARVTRKGSHSAASIRIGEHHQPKLPDCAMRKKECEQSVTWRTDSRLPVLLHGCRSNRHLWRKDEPGVVVVARWGVERAGCAAVPIVVALEPGVRGRDRRVARVRAARGMVSDCWGAGSVPAVADAARGGRDVFRPRLLLPRKHRICQLLRHS